jgi:hypothetical protein
MRIEMKILYLYLTLSILIIPKDANAGWFSKIVKEIVENVSTIFKKIPSTNLNNIDNIDNIDISKTFDFKNIDLNTPLFITKGSNIIIKNQFKDEEKNNEKVDTKDGLLIYPSNLNLDSYTTNKELKFK